MLDVAIPGSGFRRAAALLLVALSLVAASSPGMAAGLTGQKAAFVVGNDRGGYVTERVREVRALRRSGQDVRITGSVCYSTCTMLIGLPNTCVSPRTTFGFHGPSKSGRPLDPEQFERASRTIAAFYPAPIRAWYLDVARHTISGVERVSGAELIQLGIAAC